MLDSVDKAVRKYDAHPSICKIRENVKITNKFELSEVSTSDIAVQIKQVNSKKASPVDSIPARIHKENSDVFTVVIQFLFNSHMSKCIFNEELKAADITSLFKQEDAFSKKELSTNYSLTIGLKDFRTVNAKSDAALRSKFPVSTPMWLSRGLWHTACTSISYRSR